MLNKPVSEQDFVSNFILQKFREGAGVLKILDKIDFHVEKPIDGARADLVVDRGGKGMLVLEAKFKKKIAHIERDIEPRDPEVIAQAINYANIGGYPYYCTCNAKRIVLFKVISGKKAVESEIASFEYGKTPYWAEEILKLALEIIPAKAKPLDDSLVSALHEAFSDLYDQFLFALKRKLKGSEFRNKFLDWLSNQGIENNEDTMRKIAEQTTYLQLNKLFFYYIVQTVYPKLEPISIKEDEDVFEALNEYYEEVSRIDYAPIYQSDLISEIPFTDRAKERFRTLIDTLQEYDFSTMESDFIGTIYEKLIPPLDRKRLGQFYTPTGIVDTITLLTIEKPKDVVLDPGCGSGSFLVRAYQRLRELNNFPKKIVGPLAERAHQQILNQLYGADINQFPAHLTVINLTVQNSKARIEKVNVIVKDIFDIKPGQETLSGFESITAEGKSTLVKIPSVFDVVVANPPYIEQELLGLKEKKKIKNLIEQEYKFKLYLGFSTEAKKESIILDRQSDIYIYFYIHALRFLKNEGRLGFISSNKWLEVDYGEPFQRFLLNNTKIQYIIEFDRAIFPDAEVNTSVVVLQKEKQKSSRDSNLVKFVRVKEKMEVNTQLSLIQNAEESLEDHRIRINVIRQSDLKQGKWNVHLRAPPVFQRIVGSNRVKPLSSLARVFRGLTTGYDQFFILDKNTIEGHQIEPQFLAPLIRSPKNAKSLVIDNDAINYLFTVNVPKAQLKGTNALKYIQYGEKLEVEPRKGFQRATRRLPELETIKNRDPWYSLPEFEIAPILFVKMIDKQPKALLNRAKAHASNLFYYVIPERKQDIFVILGFLNSSIGALLAELYGRSYGGGVLELAAYELKRMPVIDPSLLDNTEIIAITEAFKALIKAEENRMKIEEEMRPLKSRSKKDKGLFEPELKEKLGAVIDSEVNARIMLNDSIYAALKLNDREKLQIEKGLDELQGLRRLRTEV
jgi:type I restriction-modification system DNA methylase subunit